MTTQRPLVTGARRANYAVMALLAVLFGGLSYALSARLSSVLVQPAYIDVYFDGDISRVYQNMLYRDSNHYKARVHPLFSLSVHIDIYLYIYSKIYIYIYRYLTCKITWNITCVVVLSIFSFRQRSDE